MDPFEKIGDREQELLEALDATALLLLPEQPIPALVRAFHWVEERRQAKDWHVLELGLALLRTQSRSAPELIGLSSLIEAYLGSRRSPWLKLIRAPPGKVPYTRAQLARAEKRGERVTRQRKRILGAMFKAGESIELFSVIGFPKADGSIWTTVYGFKSKTRQWPTPAQVARDREAVKRANARAPGGKPRK